VGNAQGVQVGHALGHLQVLVWPRGV